MMCHFCGSDHRFNVCSHSITIHHVAWSTRKIPLSYSKHVTGRYSAGPGHPPVPFESLLEREVIVALLGLPWTEQVLGQPLTVSYSVSRTQRTYTPDILVRLRYVPPALSALGWENSTLIEVKPSAVRDRCASRIRFKLRVAELATRLPGICVAEEDIQLLRSLSLKEWGI